MLNLIRESTMLRLKPIAVAALMLAAAACSDKAPVNGNGSYPSGNGQPNPHEQEK